MLKACCRHCYRVSTGQLDVTWPCLEWLGAGIGAVARGRNGQFGWGAWSKRKSLLDSVGWLACLCSWFLLWLLAPPPLPTHHPYVVCAGPVSPASVRAVWAVLMSIYV